MLFSFRISKRSGWGENLSGGAGFEDGWSASDIRNASNASEVGLVRRTMRRELRDLLLSAKPHTGIVRRTTPSAPPVRSVK